MTTYLTPSIRTCLVAAVVWATVPAQVNAQGVPVGDTSVEVATTTLTVTTLINDGIKLASDVTKIEHLLETLENMKGNWSGALGMLFDADLEAIARQYIPDEYEALLSLGEDWNQSPGGEIGAAINALRSKVSSLPTDFFAPGSDSANALKSRVTSLARQMAVGEAAYRASTQRSNSVSDLIKKSASANTQAKKLDASNRLLGEQALIANEANRQSVLRYQQQVEADLREQQSLERLSQQMHGTYTAVNYGTDDLP